MPTTDQLHRNLEADFEFKLNLPKKPYNRNQNGEVLGEISMVNNELKITPIRKTKIEFYDFDGVVCASPEDTEGRIIWKEKTGMDYPHIGWWGRPESLSLDIFDIQPVPCILEKLNNKQDNIITVLLTARMGKLSNEIKAVLDKHNIKLDYVTFKESYYNKGQRIDHFLQKNKDVTEVDFYDDTVKHFEDCKFLIEKYPNIVFNFFHVVNLENIISYAI